MFTGSVNIASPLQAAMQAMPVPGGLSLAEKIGQMLQVQCLPGSTSENALDLSNIVEVIKRYHLGSLDLRVGLNGPNLMRARAESVAIALNRLQGTGPIPLLIGADIERGIIARVADAPDMPSVMAWGALGDPSRSMAVGEVTGEEARAVGIHWAFAPVADVNNDPENPIIGDRSFGDDPVQVGQLSAEFIHGAHAKGLLTTAKHFPGHGDSDVDSHVDVVTLNRSLAQLKQVEFPPFEQAIAAGVDAVMLAHARVPALDPDPHRIATTSRKIIQGTLRHDLGFKGVVVTDSMVMRGLTDLYKGDPNPVGRAAVDAIKAGADILMLPAHVDQAYDAILHAVKTGEIPESRIDESVRRILAMKERAGLFQNRFVDVSKVNEVFARKDAWDLAQTIADESVTLVRDNTFKLPLKVEGNLSPSSGRVAGKMVLVLFSDSLKSPLGRAFEKSLRERQPDVQVRHIYYDRRAEWETTDLLTVVAGADQVLVGAFMTNLPGKKAVGGGKIVDVVGLNGESAALFKQVVDTAGPKGVVVALGSPYLILKYPEIQNYVCTFSVSSTSERAVVKALFGQIGNKARLPVNLPGIAERGFAIPWPQSTSNFADGSTH